MFKNIRAKISEGARRRKRLSEEDLIGGDHIYVRRAGLLYSHHGIYAGKGTVINYKGENNEKRDPGVILTEIKRFLNGGKLRRRIYQQRLPHSKSLKIARNHLSKKGYSLAFNNCEHFATYCATGKRKSRQVQRTIGSLFTITAVATTLALKSISRGKRG